MDSYDNPSGNHLPSDPAEPDALPSAPGSPGHLPANTEGQKLPPRIVYMVSKPPSYSMPRPWITMLILIINLGVFIFLEWMGGSQNSFVLERLGALERTRVWQGEYYRLLTAMFMHIGYMHLISNLFALYMLGNLIEPFYGQSRFLLIYLLSGLFGNAVSLLFLDGISAGASGAILGMAGALLSRISSIKGRVPERRRRTIFLIILVLISFDVVLGFTLEHINNGAHVGGVIAGWWLSYALVQMKSADRGQRWSGRLLTTCFALVFILTCLGGIFQVWNARYWLARGNILLRRGAVDAGISHLERAVERDPSIREAYRLLAHYHYERKNLEKVLLYGRRAAADRPEDPMIHEWLERAYRHLGHPEEARAEMNLYLGLMANRLVQSRNQPREMNNLAYSLAERELLLDQALDLAMRANQATNFSNPAFLDTLAWVFYRRGDYEKAEQIMRPVAASADLPIYQYHLGAILTAAGKTQEGRNLIQQSIEGGLFWWDRLEAEEILAELDKPV